MLVIPNTTISCRNADITNISSSSSSSCSSSSSSINITILIIRKCDNKMGFSGKMQRYTHGNGEGNLRSRLQAIKSGNEGVLCHPACSPGSLTATKH